jgi:uncharacterized OB-fold protein
VSDPVSPAATVAAAWREGRLLFPVAPDGTAVWPPRAAAPGSGAPLVWRESAGRGTVYATTALHARDAAPRNLALIDLDEGFRMLSRVEGPAGDAVPIGLRVQVRFSDPDPEGGERLPVFVPLGEDSGGAP